MSEHRTLTAKEVRASIMRCFAVKRPAFLWGPPGIGKSELVEGITRDLNGVMFDLRLGQMEPTDIRGIPFYKKEENVMDWAPPIDLPQGEQALISELINVADNAVEAALANAGGKAKKEDLKLSDLPVVVLFLDEMNSAPPSVLAAAYQLILNRRIGKYVLPDNVVVIAAGNRESDKGVTYRMPTPLANRFIHIEMRADFEAWLDWAVNNNIHEDVVGYLSFAKQDLYDFDAKSASRAFATPRSWSFVSELLDEPMEETTATDLVAGAIGEGLAVKFQAHRKIAGKLPNPEDVLSGKVKELEVKEVSAMYSLVISMCYELKEAHGSVKESEWHGMTDNFFRFMMDNFETELVVMGARIALTTYNLPFQPTKLKNFDEFHNRYGKYILASQS